MRSTAVFQAAALLLLLPWQWAFGQRAAPPQGKHRRKRQPLVFLRRSSSSARGLQQSPIPDFTIGDEASLVNREEVVFWYFTLEGTVPTSIVADVSQRLSTTISQITGFDAVVNNITGTLESMNTGTMWQQLVFEIMVLPTPGAAERVAAAINTWMPYPGHPDSGKAFKELFGWEAGDYGIPTGSEEVKMEAEPVQIQARSVRRPVQIRESEPLPLPSTGTRPPSPTLWRPPATNFTGPDPTAGDPCAAQTAPCLCALASGCSWTGDAWYGSCAATLAGEATGTSCAACPAQPSCEMNSCVLVREACQCAAVTTGCSWIASSSRCRDRGSTGAPVPCSACPHQYSCRPPQLISVRPGQGALFLWSPGLTSQPKIRATFDREVSYCPAVTSDTAALVLLHCDLRQAPLGLLLTSLLLNGTVLTISIPYNSDSATSTCSLEILEGLICDAEGVPFLGLRKDGYHFLLGEAVKPSIVTVDPPENSAEALFPLTVSLAFNERIRLTNIESDAVRLQTRHGEQPPVPLPLVEGNVFVEEKELRLSFGTRADPGTEYSLVFPSGAVADLSGNPFPGLPLGTYVFRTSAGGATAAAVQEPFAIPWGMVAAAASGALLIGTICTCAALRCQRARGRKVMDEAPEFSENKGSNDDNLEQVTNSASFTLCYTTFRERSEAGSQRASVVGGKSSRSSLASSPSQVKGTASFQEGKSTRSSVMSASPGQMMVKVPTEHSVGQLVHGTPSTRSLPMGKVPTEQSVGQLVHGTPSTRSLPMSKAKTGKSVTFTEQPAPSEGKLPAIRKVATDYTGRLARLPSLPSDARDLRSSTTHKALGEKSGQTLDRPAQVSRVSMNQPMVTKAVSEPQQQRARRASSDQMAQVPSGRANPYMNRSSRGRSVVQEVW